MRILVVAVILCLLSSAGFCAADPHALGRVVVTPSRLLATDRDRSVVIIDEPAAASAAHTALADTLDALSNTDIRRRGIEGMQADLAIRGTNFEQNTVLVNGIRLNDVQTGHYTMDIPLTALDIDTVEIVNGPASSLYGPNSFGGTVNIIPKRYERPELIATASGGRFNYVYGAVSAAYPLGPVTNRTSFEEARSTGYRPETDFSTIVATHTASLEMPYGGHELLVGYTHKDYGAASFYSNLFPREHEETDTRFIVLSSTIEHAITRIAPKFFMRRHGDKFILDRTRPGWQTNYHTSYTYGGEVTGIVEHACAATAFGIELSRDTIDSTNLAKHDRTRTGFYTEVTPHLPERFFINAGIRLDRFTDFGWQYAPTITARVDLAPALALRGLVGRTYRIPTFTDLYYNDAANQGNPSLEPEEAWSYEAGLRATFGMLRADATYFVRQSSNTIDWIRNTTSQPWHVENIGSVTTNGVELSVTLHELYRARDVRISNCSIAYTAIDEYHKHDYLSKYAFDYLKHAVTVRGAVIIGGLRNDWTFNFKKRVGMDPVLVIDTKLTKEIFVHRTMSCEAYCSVSNLSNVAYEEIPGVPMPGIWITSGARIKF